MRAMPGQVLSQRILESRNHRLVFSLFAFIAAVLTTLLYSGPGKNSVIAFTLSLLILPVFSASRRSFVSAFPYLALLYLGANLDYFISTQYPRADSYSLHMVSFQYFADALASGAGFPEWFPAAGGVRIGVSQINLGFALPHRLLGYMLYAVTPLSTLAAYKLAFGLGMLLICLGWGLYLERLTGSGLGACVGVIAIMLGGTGAAFHQEQVLFTITYVPWLLLALYELKNDRRWLLVLTILLGLAATTHFPHTYLLSIAFFLLVTAVFVPTAVMSRLFAPGWRIAILAVVFFILSSLPLLYTALHIGEFESLHRPTLDVTSHEEYLDLLGVPEGLASAPGYYFEQYLFPVIGLDYPNMDMTGLYVGRIVLALAAAGILVLSSRVLAMAVLGLLFAFLTMGFRSPVDLVTPLYYFMTPIIKSFREWYHFFPFINLSLSALAATGVVACQEKLGTVNRRVLPFLYAALMLLIFSAVYDLVRYSRDYGQTYVVGGPPAHINLFERIRGPSHDPSLVQYRARMAVDHCCGEAVPDEAYVTTEITSIHPGNVEYQIQATRDKLLADRSGVVADIPTELLRQIEPNRRITPIIDSTFRFDGADFRVNTSAPALFVSPINYDLGLGIRVNDTESRGYRVNGALAGVLIPAGEHVISFRIKPDGYLYMLTAQILCMVVGAGLIALLLTRRLTPS